MPQVSLQTFLDGVTAGALVSFPTDTVPALAVRPDQGDRIYATKQRPDHKPLILMAAHLGDLLPYLITPPPQLRIWTEVTDRHWPGALTLVLPASDRVPLAINPQQTGTIGVRVPDHPLARYLLSQTGPLATTSVNRSGQPALETMAAIRVAFPELLTLADTALAQIYPLLGQSSPPPADQPEGSGLPSTVAQWQGQDWTILRQGSVNLNC